MMSVLSVHKKLVIGVVVGLFIIVGLVVVLFALPKPASEAFPLSAGDSVTSWSLQNIYAGNVEGAARIQTEIDRLKGLLGKGEFPDYDIYVGIAQNAELLGDGKTAYESLERAIDDNPARFLAYGNLGHLMVKLKAYKTARMAFEKAVEVDNSNFALQNHLAYLEFMTSSYSGASEEDIQEAFDTALTAFPGNNDVQSLKTKWQSN